MKKFTNLKDRLTMKKNNDGFTLVELIVVLVILAILAAILVPALLGYIDRARGQQVVLNAKSCLTAAQAEMSSLYGEDKAASDITSRATRIINTASGDGADFKVKTLKIGSKKDASNPKTAYKITYAMYQEDGKDPVYFDGKAWSNDEATAPDNVFDLSPKGGSTGNDSSN